MGMSRGSISIAALGLKVGPLIPIEAEPRQAVEDGLLFVGFGARVGVRTAVGGQDDGLFLGG